MAKSPLLYFWFYSFLCMFLYGCTAVPGELKKAEGLMDTTPDSAYHVLQHLKRGRLISNSNKALYALLMSQALDKNDIKVESDSLIRIATDYYTENDPVHAGYAWFYRARCANNRGNATFQADALLKAQEFAGKTDNYKLQGLVYCDKGLMYKAQEKIDSSFCYFNRAYQSFKRIRDDRNCIICLIYAGDECVHASRCKSAIAYFQLAGRIAKHTKDTLILSTIYRNLGIGYFKGKDYTAALHYFHLAPLTHIGVYDSNKWYLLADAFLNVENTDSACYYLRKVTQLHEMAPDYYRLWEVYYEKEGNISKALYYAKQVTVSKDSIYKRNLDVSFAGLEKKYKYQGLQLENENLTIKDKQNNILLLFALFVLSLGGIVVLAWRYRTKNHQLKVQQQLLEQEKELIQREKDNNRLQEQELKMKNILLEKEKDNNLLQEQELKMKNILLSNVAQYRKHSVKRPATSPGTQTVISPVLNQTFHEELVANMDIQHHDISYRLKERYPDLTERDILICCLLLAGFDTGMIATILNVKNDSIKIQRSRLRKKLKLQASQNLTDYLRQF